MIFSGRYSPFYFSAHLCFLINSEQCPNYCRNVWIGEMGLRISPMKGSELHSDRLSFQYRGEQPTQPRNQVASQGQLYLTWCLNMIHNNNDTELAEQNRTQAVHGLCVSRKVIVCYKARIKDYINTDHIALGDATVPGRELSSQPAREGACLPD